jgi:uncharacterized membrane protein
VASPVPAGPPPQAIGSGGTETRFQWGHVAISIVWSIAGAVAVLAVLGRRSDVGLTLGLVWLALVALVSLYAGLRRGAGLLRGGGFILFGISLGKIFLFDLPSLSSVQRALSFLAVGAVLLLGGFFYQRLSAQFDER